MGSQRSTTVVVTDTGPLRHLLQAGVLELLELIGSILVPQAVFDELNQGPADISKLEFSVEQATGDIESNYPHLDPGETAALILCTERDALLLTDDLDARTTATNEGVEVHGSVGVILYGYNCGELSEEMAKSVLQTLQQDTNLYLSTPILEYAIELVEADDAGW